MKKQIKIADLEKIVNEAYDKCKDIKEGANANYIPFLGSVDSNLFGISVCLPNGKQINVGDIDYKFGIESISKVHTAILILQQYGKDKVLEMIGADATGLPFNSVFAILLENDHPSNPLVHAGAIPAASMVKPVGDSNSKRDAIVDDMMAIRGRGV